MTSARIVQPRYIVNADGTDVDADNPLAVSNTPSKTNTGDVLLDIAAGNISGVSHVNKFGRNATIAASGAEHIWDGSTDYTTTPTFPTSAVITHAWSAVDSANTQGLIVEVQGLDENWALATDTVTLDGADSATATAFTNATTFIRIFRMKVTDSTSADQELRVGDSGKADYYAAILANTNQTLMAIYTVPANKTAYITKYYVSVNETSNKDIEGIVKMIMFDRANDYIFQVKHIMGLDSDATSVIEHDFKPYYKVTEKTDITILFANAVAQVADVSAGFDLILIDD